MDYNKVILCGNLTRDPEIKYTASGTAVCNSSLAINRKYKTQDGQGVEEVCFVEITAYGSTAENIGKFLKKGSPLFVEGRLKLDQWEKDGAKRSKLLVIVEKFLFVPKAGGKTENQEPQDINDDDIPF